MNNLSIIEDTFEIVDEDDEVVNQERFGSGTESLLGYDYDKAIWRDIRRKPYPELVDGNMGISHRRETAEYLKAFSGWVDAKLYFAYEGVHVSIPVHIRSGPHAVVAFFEEADDLEFQEFCGLLTSTSKAAIVFQRISLIASHATTRSNVSALPFSKPLALLEGLPELPLPDARAEVANDQDSLPTGIRRELEEIEQLLTSGRIDDGLDKLYSRIDALFKQGRFSVVDLMFKVVRPKEASLDLLLGLLVSTLPVKRRARSRPAFFLATKAELERRGEDASDLLNGLE